ncbi:hemerythrin domain-containing protein [Blastococcus sp. PRF04-17]|uniref:hemerythrin domain-containing protein n=1 Tax=Blastococcus sp. PRF04-17 TaxID=2933797 RepID=UPI001FF6460B|nr:hemerythrin domain-containing protein [Blastococcus sp. PRF04-17]UOY01741.1 hemerythrin domain-containing protein [Blastococcus sp. PRF04-17]
MTSTNTTTQLLLPGQAAAPEGPIDLTPMWLMHHAFRRDLAAFAAAAQTTPLDDRATWQALSQRWQRFANVLHHHHSGEDTYIWPVLLAAVDEAGDPAGRETLEAMEAEHAQIDPLLERCARGFAALGRRGDAAARAELAECVATTRERLAAHLGHEERDAMALVQRLLTPEAWHALDKQIGSGYPVREVPFTLAWVLHGLPADALPRAKAFLGTPAYTLATVVFRRGFERGERAAFRYA